MKYRFVSPDGHECEVEDIESAVVLAKLWFKNEGTKGKIECGFSSGNWERSSLIADYIENDPVDDIAPFGWGSQDR